jgi:hypothetical protein
VSGYEGVAVVTQALAYVAGGAARVAVPEVTVTMTPPEQRPAAARDEPRLNIYLVQAQPEPTRVGDDLPHRDGAGNLLTRARVSLNLRYLLSFYGPAPKAHLMFGAVELALREQAVLAPATIVDATANQPDLNVFPVGPQSSSVGFSPRSIALEDLSRFWSGFFQVPYTLSSLYDASVVVLESGTTPMVALPVRSYTVGAFPGLVHLNPLPVVDYAAGLAVPVSGPGVSPGLPLSVAGAWADVEVGPTGGLQFLLPSGTPSGINLVRPGMPGLTGTPPTINPVAAAQPLVVRPVASAAGFSAATRELEVTVSPPPPVGAAVTAFVVRVDGPAGSPPTSAAITAQAGDAGAAVRFSLPAIEAGHYLVLVEVDSIQSVPSADPAPYGGPQVVLS